MPAGSRTARRLALGAATGLVLSACSVFGPTPSPHITCPTQAPSGSQVTSLLADASDAVFQTSKGSFTISLYGDKAPIATANFVALARCGFYDGITFHRVVAGFVVQAGDPQTKKNQGVFDGLGSGGPGYEFAIESPTPDLTYDKYVVAMANALQRDTAGNIVGGENSNGSQFFIDLVDLPSGFPRDYTIFGKVTDGTSVIDTIGQVPTNGTPDTGPQNVPLDPVVIQSITVRGKAQQSSG
jgi:cyclophilin family peptidyl-prolyl cis-trans isomerase